MTRVILIAMVVAAVVISGCTDNREAVFVEPFDRSLEEEFEGVGLRVHQVDDLVLGELGPFRLIRFQAPACGKAESTCVAKALAELPWDVELTRETEMLEGSRSSSGLTASAGGISCTAEVLQDGNQLPPYLEDFKRSTPNVERSWFARFECDTPD